MSTLIVAMLIIITTISIPLIFILINNKKRKRRYKTLLNLFSQEGSKRGLSFSSHEILRNKIIGIDGLQQALLVFSFESPDPFVCIMMKEVKTCSVQKRYESIIVGTEKKPKLEPELRTIDLTFSFKNNAEPVSVSIYNSAVNSIYEMAELETKARTWEAVLSKMIVKEAQARA